jgi:short subunit dehydrogenase-like uncharacterized protein
MMNFLLYGVTGYTAQLMLPLCAKYGLTPIIAGRNAEKVTALAQQYGFDFEIFDLEDTSKLDAALSKVPLVLNCAGPFQHTAKAMMDACLRLGVHYLDITGEISVFEAAAALNDAAQKSNILLMPGTGFDVVPTDCTALLLKEKMPDATHLKLAWTSVGGGISHGTALTMLEGAGEKSAVRKDGKIIAVPLGHKGMEVDFGEIKRFSMTIPWGDVSTAYYTTGIPNIEVYREIHPKVHKKLRWQGLFNWYLRSDFAKSRAKKKILSAPAGPSENRRQKSKMLIWGEVTNAKGEKIETRLTTCEGYTLTAHSALRIAQRVLSGDFKIGFQTPASLYGSGFIGEFSGLIA